MLYRPTIILDRHLNIKSTFKYYQKGLKFEHIENTRELQKVDILYPIR